MAVHLYLLEVSKITLDFIVGGLIRLSGASLPISVKVSTGKGLEYTIDSSSIISVINDLSFKLPSCCFSNSITRVESVIFSLHPFQKGSIEVLNWR